MSGRERKMAVVLGVIAGGYVVWQFLLPTVRERLFAIQDENERLQARVEELDRQLGAVDKARRTYREYVERTGVTDAEAFRTIFYNKLQEMAKEAGFVGDLRMQPSPISEHKPAGWRRKSDIKEVRFTISADGTLESAVAFLKTFYELPYIAQITSLKIESAGSRYRRSASDTVELRATIETLVPPNHPVGQVNPELITPVSMKVKHDDRNYAMIWDRNPFQEYVEPVVVKKPPPRPPQDNSPVEPQEPPERPIGDPQAQNKMIKMAMIYGDPESPIGELLVFNTRDMSSEYVGEGDELDGGEVQLVHPWGAVTRRENGEERVYPIKKTLAESQLVEDAFAEYPELVYAYERLMGSEASEETAGEFVGPEIPDPASEEDEPAISNVPAPLADAVDAETTRITKDKAEIGGEGKAAEREDVAKTAGDTREADSPRPKGGEKKGTEKPSVQKDKTGSS